MRTSDCDQDVRYESLKHTNTRINARTVAKRLAVLDVCACLCVKHLHAGEAKPERRLVGEFRQLAGSLLGRRVVVKRLRTYLEIGNARATIAGGEIRETQVLGARACDEQMNSAVTDERPTYDARRCTQT